MKGLFIPEITAEMFRNGCLESIEALMAEGEIYDIEYEPERKGNWVGIDDEPCETFECDRCGFVLEDWIQGAFYNFCPWCGADMRGEEDA